MNSDILFYGIAVLTIALTFGAALVLPIPDTFRGLITLPGLVALFSIVIEAWRSKRSHERSLELQERQQDNSLAIASHMANTVFDRQVAFGEAYFEKAHNSLLEMLTTGPKPAAVEQSQELTRIRNRYSPWLSPKIDAGFLAFERGLRDMGSNAELAQMNLPPYDQAYHTDRMYDIFMNISQLQIHAEDKSGNNETPEEAVAHIINHLRNVLGVDRLTDLREQALNLAVSRTSSRPRESSDSG